MGNSNNFYMDFVNITVNTILKTTNLIIFEKIDNFEKLANFVDNYEKYNLNRIYIIENNRISLKKYDGKGYYQLTDLKTFKKIIRKIRKKLGYIKDNAKEYLKHNKNYSEQEFDTKKMLIENELIALIKNIDVIDEDQMDRIIKTKKQLNKLDQIIINRKIIDKILIFLKLTEEFENFEEKIKNIQKKETSNIQLDRHLENILEQNNLNFKFKLIFKYNNKISEYNVDNFVLNYPFFQIITSKGNFKENIEKEIILQINHQETGKDFIEFLYTNKIPTSAIKNVKRIESLKILSDFCGIDSLNQTCILMLEQFSIKKNNLKS